MRLYGVVLIMAAILLGSVKSQPCPSNANIGGFNTGDGDINLPLTAPLCVACRFLDIQGNRIPFSDGVWSIVGGPTLVNGSFNGNVTLTSNFETMAITLTYPDAVVDVGDQLRCESSLGNHIITIGAFSFLEPLVTPAGTVDIIEGSNVTLTCNDPGNTGVPRYVWINETDDTELTQDGNITPLLLTLTDINRTASGNYTCRTTLPGASMETSRTINVQYLDTPLISMDATLPQGSTLNINCSYVANPPVGIVTWFRNGSVLNPDSLSHISATDSTGYSTLTLSPLAGLDDSGDYYCIVNNTVSEKVSSTSTYIIQVNPDPVIGLSVDQVTTNSVRLRWSLGFNGNAELTGSVVNYTAIANGVGTAEIPLAVVTERIVTGLQPFTNYSFSVIVTNIVGNSSEEIVFAKTLPLVPTAPTLDSVNAINSTTLEIMWTNNINTLTQSQVDQYKVVYYIEGQSDQPIEEIVTAPTTSFITPQTLSKGTRYTVMVYATNSAGESTVSNTLTARTDIDPPSSVSGLFLTPYPDSICVSWGPPADNGGQYISQYRVYSRDQTTPTFSLIDTPTNTTMSLLLMPLSPNTQYSVIVAAANSEGGHGMNSSMTVQTGSQFAVDNSVGLISNEITALSASVRWAINGTIYQSIRLQYRMNDTEWSISREVNVTGMNSYLITNLTPETNYDVRLILRATGNCLQRVSNTITFNTLELQVVVDPSNTTVTAGEGVVLACNLDTGGPPPTAVTWSYNGGPTLPDSVMTNGSRLIISESSESDSGNYTCTFGDAFFTFPLIINPSPTTPAPTAFTFPDYAIYAIAGVVGLIIIIFIIILIIACCCLCSNKEKDITKTKYNFSKKGEDGMWLDEGASGFAPANTYRPTHTDSVDYPMGRGRSLTNDMETATSFDTLDKDTKGSKEKLTTPNVYSAHTTGNQRPYDENRVEYATVASTTFNSNSRQYDV